MIVGRQAKVVRQLSAAEVDGLKEIAMHYVKNAARFAAGLTRLS